MILNIFFTVLFKFFKSLSNSEAKRRYYDNFEGDINRVVIFLTPVAIISKLNTVYILWTITISKVNDMIFPRICSLFCPHPPPPTHTYTHTRTHTTHTPHTHTPYTHRTHTTHTTHTTHNTCHTHTTQVFLD